MNARRADWVGLTLEANALAVTRGGIAILQGINFRLTCGQALVLRGPNGMGKTTLLRTLAGLQPPLSGAISVLAEHFTYAAHADGLKSVLTARENLEFWASVYDQTGVQDALVAMDLTHLANRRAAELSTGQKRRLGLARLLVTGRWLWLLDEPTVSLDAASSALFVAALRAHLSIGGAAIIATHIDLGLPEAQILDLTPFRAGPDARSTHGFDEAFL